ncbi:4254_t:CDS:2, partial [Gigaspora margarita]
FHEESLTILEQKIMTENSDNQSDSNRSLSSDDNNKRNDSNIPLLKNLK